METTRTINSKTASMIKDLREHLCSKYSPNQTVRYTDVEPYMKGKNIHVMNFYFFVYSKCITKVQRGVYRVTPLLFTMEINTICNKAADVIKEKKDIKALVNKSKPIVYTPTLFKTNANVDITESQCIAFLKNLGYKLLKPVNKYEEI
jgi:hypothetical protein